MVSLLWSLDRDNFKKITMKSSTFEMSTSRYYFKAGIACLCSINMVKVNGSIATASDVGEFWIHLPSCISESMHPKNLQDCSASPHPLKPQQSLYLWVTTACSSTTCIWMSPTPLGLWQNWFGCLFQSYALLNIPQELGVKMTQLNFTQISNMLHLQMCSHRRLILVPVLGYIKISSAASTPGKYFPSHVISSLQASRMYCFEQPMKSGLRPNIQKDTWNIEIWFAIFQSVVVTRRLDDYMQFFSFPYISVDRKQDTLGQMRHISTSTGRSGNFRDGVNFQLVYTTFDMSSPSVHLVDVIINEICFT